MKVGMFTTFRQIMEEYSLCRVATNELKMLVNGGHKVVALVVQGFKPPEGSIWEHPWVELREIPGYTIGNDGVIPNDFRAKADTLTEKLREVLNDVKVCITHDIIYQKAHRIYNQAARNLAAERVDLKWLHHLHSCPVLAPENLSFPESLEHTRFPRSWILYPNSYDISRAAKMFGIEETEVKRVHHPIDVCEFFGFHEYTRKLVEEKDLLSADVIGVYPLRLDRGKQPEKVIGIFAELKKLGNNVRLVIADFHSTGGDKVDFRNEMLNSLTGLGLTNKEVTFTSQIPMETSVEAEDLAGNVHELKPVEIGCPHQMVKDLMVLSNLFILPSRTETYSLIAQEAALCRNLLVLNQDFAPMRSIYGDEPIYAQFSGNVHPSGRDFGEINTSFSPDEQAYFRDVACWINYYLKDNPILSRAARLRKERNLSYVFQHELEPLLYGIGGAYNEAQVLSAHANV